ncbi:MAG: hypothetical protein AB7V32_01635, partial [Candidatus Berkiella sp.]
MVKIRDDLPKAQDGSIDITAWVERIGQHRPSQDKALLTQAALLNVQNGGHHLTCVNESCLRQALVTAETLATL